MAAGLNERVESVFATDPESHLFIKNLDRHLGTSNVFQKFVRRTYRNFESSLLHSYYPANRRHVVPSFTHRIWVTSATEPSFPPEEYLIECLKAARGMPEDATHFFWTNNEDVAAHLRGRLAAFGVTNGIVVDITTLGTSLAMLHARRLLADRKFVLAADILKFLVLQRYGGIYADFGVFYDNQIFFLAKFNEYTFIMGESNFLQASFLAAPPDASLLSILLGVISEPAALHPGYALMGSGVSALDEVHLFAGLGLTACALLFLPLSARAIVLPPQSDYHSWRGQQSWYGTAPKHGNVLVAQTGASVLEATSFVVAAQLVEQRFTVFGNDTMMRERLRTLLILHAHFLSNPTEMCRKFYFTGSDKALGWHNYSYLYNFFMPATIERTRNFLEIGAATESLETPTTAGLTRVPGASLKAWRDSFPDARIFGADAHGPLLFSEDGIQTLFVDQFRTETIVEMFAHLGERRFDVIIDDGLHNFEANRNVLEIGLPWLAAGGIYVVEDIPNGEIPLWKNYLERNNIPSALIELPNHINSNDNNIAVICPDVIRTLK